MIELLESRIAPAAVVHFTETDGDKITVKTSKGTKAYLELALGIVNGAAGVNKFTVNLIEDHLPSGIFADANLTITAKRGGSGNGLADRVTVDAFDGGAKGIDLRNVNIEGNLTYIDVGDANLATEALHKLTVTNFLPSGSASAFEGNVGKIVVKQDMNGYLFSVEAFTGDSGTIIGTLFVRGDIASSGGDQVGYIKVQKINHLTIRGALIGSQASSNNGVINVVDLAHVEIGRISNVAQIQLSAAT